MTFCQRVLFFGVDFYLVEEFQLQTLLQVLEQGKLISQGYMYWIHKQAFLLRLPQVVDIS